MENEIYKGLVLVPLWAIISTITTLAGVIGAMFLIMRADSKKFADSLLKNSIDSITAVKDNTKALGVLTEAIKEMRKK